MKQKSDLRDRRIWEAQKKGLPVYDYYSKLWVRWARIFGPDIFIAPMGKYLDCTGAGSQTQGGRLLWSASREIIDVAHRISKVIEHNATDNAFWSDISCAHREFVAVYMRGERFILYEPPKCRRFFELYFAYSLLGGRDAIENFEQRLASAI